MTVGSGVTSDDAAPAIVVDPRMRSRRIGVRRDAGRRRLRRLTLGLAVVAVVVGAAVATQTPLLDVDRVAVSGAARTGDDAVVAAAGVRPGDALVSVDTGGAADRVEELPWVATAEVTRSWPSTVEVRVTEREPMAIIQVTGTHAALVDADGWVLAIERRDPAASGADGDAAEGTPDEGGAAGGPGDDADADAAGGEAPLVLTGIDGEVGQGDRLDGDARAALEVAAVLSERLPGVVASVSTDLDAELVDGGTVRFGDADDLDDKVTAVKTVLDEVVVDCLEVLDVQVPGSPALTRNQTCS